MDNQYFNLNNYNLDDYYYLFFNQLLKICN